MNTFADPIAALAWIDVGDEGLLEKLEPQFGARTSTDSPMIAAARAGLDRNSLSSLDDLARRIGVSPRTLQRRLQDVGTTFQQEAITARLRLAKRLLRDSDRSIKWIAFECGFASHAHFSAFFHQHEGMPPSRWRVFETD